MQTTNSRPRNRASQARNDSTLKPTANADKARIASAASPASTSASGTEDPARAQRVTAAEAPDVVREPLSRTLQDTLLDERDDVLAVINELEDQLDRYEEIRQSLEHDLTNKSEQLQASNQRVQELEWQVVALQTRVEALEQVRQELTLLEEELGDANGRAQRLAEQVKRAEKENTRLAGELKTATKQAQELWIIRKERDGLRLDLRNLRAKLEQTEQANQEISDERAQLQARLQETVAALDATRNVQHRLERDRRAALDRNQELQHVQQAIEEKLDTLRAEKKGLQGQIAHLERENTRLSEQRRFYDSELNALRGMNRNAESALANVKKAFTEVRVALSETKSRVRRRTTELCPRLTTGLSGINITNAQAPSAPLANEPPPPATTDEDDLAAAGLAADDPADAES